VSFFSYVYRNGLWISIPVFIMSVVALVYFILDVIKVMKQARLTSVPLVEEQEVEFAEASRVVLCVEGPIFTSRFANLSYTLISPDGNPVEKRRSWFRSHTSSFSKVRMELEYYKIPRPGQYTLHIVGLEPGEKPDNDHQIVFMLPHLAQSVARVVGIVLASIFLIGSLVLFLMRFLSQGDVS
jgi:hypothetical protein